MTWFGAQVLASLVMMFCAIPPSNAQQRVELELVLAVDTSTSVNADEYALQVSGLAAAFVDPRVLAAIDGLGPEGMAVSVVQWAGAGQQAVAVDWTLVNSKESALIFSRRISAMDRNLDGFTDIAGAINYSIQQLETNAYDGQRLAIDVSGDGTSDRNDPAPSRDRAILRGITVNGLVIHNFEYDLGDLARIELFNHYRDNVIGGPGAFLLNAESFETFAESMREKLYREISGPLFAGKF